MIDDDAARDASRPTAILLALFAMRFMEQWKLDVDDNDATMIQLAVVAISGERLLRGKLTAEERRLATAIKPERLARCNVSSIASATGINRETTRRKVNALIEQGLLVRDRSGRIAFAPGMLQRESMLALVRRQLEAVTRVANELIRLGVLRDE
jgi:hypothetical protein